MTTFTRPEIEAGRALFAAPWDFKTAAVSTTSLPAMHGLEIAFAGRSNVGKSSLINAVTGNGTLARTSNTPGRTQELIFFSAGGMLTIVDMPGYGFAQAPKDKVDAWTSLIHEFLRGRRNLARVYVLIDARHGLKNTDDEILKSLGEAAVSHEIVLTKSDAVKPSALEQTLAATKAAIERRPAAFPDVLVTSAETGSGIPELRAAIARLVRERK